MATCCPAQQRARSSPACSSSTRTSRTRGRSRRPWGTSRRSTQGLVAGFSYTHARTDHLTRFFNANDPVFGDVPNQGPWSTGLAGGNGIGALTVVQSTAKSRYNGITAEFRRRTGTQLQFQVNYTLSFDKADDDNERDPFTFRYARADSLEKEYNWSDRDQRHRFNAWVLAILPGDFYFNNRVSAYSAQPASEVCGPGNVGTGQRASTPAQRICPDGHVLQRNTIRRDNAYFSWDIRLSRPFNLGQQGVLEADLRGFQRYQQRQLQGSVVGRHLPQFRRNDPERAG